LVAIRGKRLGNVAVAERFDALGSVDDLNRALKVTRESVVYTDPNDRQASGRWHSLAILLRRLFRRNLDTALLDEAIDLHIRAVENSSESSPTFADWLNRLANALGDRYEFKGELKLSWLHIFFAMGQQISSIRSTDTCLCPTGND
jgi:hypothetical protein